MRQEHQFYTPGDEEEPTFNGVTYEDRPDSIHKAGGFTVAHVVEPKADTEPEQKISKYGTPYMNGMDYRGVDH